MADGAEVARALDEIALLLTLSEQSAFKVRAYERAARIVEDLGDELSAAVEREALTQIEGIGDKLASQIRELVRTGRSRLLEELRQQHPPGAVQLARVRGLTTRRMQALSRELGVGSIDELVQACRARQVRTLRGFGPKTEAKLLQAALQANAPAPAPRVLLSEAQELAERIGRALREPGVAQRVHSAGALRRCEETLERLELVVVAERAEPVWERLAQLPSVVRVDRASATARLARGIELVVHMTGEDREAATLLAATGPAAHVAALSARAQARNRSLEALDSRRNAHTGEPPGGDEAAIYRGLELAYVPPELRGRPGDFDPAGYEDLILQEHIQGVVHCHTQYSDGRDSIEAMARAAEALGMQYIAITDHSPSAHYARGVALDRLAAQWDEIARVQEHVNVRILRGTESDILADGRLDYPDAVLERFDIVIASVHARHGMDRARMTQRLVAAMRNPVFKIWGHALGRILLSRPAVECDVLAVLDALAESRGAIELNADPHRLDLPADWIPHARERGIPFVISVDAHSTAGLNVLPLGISQARRGGLRRNEVLNALPASDFAQRVRPTE